MQLSAAASGPLPQRVHDRAEPRVGDLGRPSSSGSSARAGLGARRAGARPGRARPRRAPAWRWPRRPRQPARPQRGLQPLGLDPELGGVHAELERGLARERGRLLSVADLGQHQRHPRERVGAAARAAARRRCRRSRGRARRRAGCARRGDALGEGLARPRRRRNVSGSWPAGQQRDLHAQAPRSPRTCPARFTPQVSPPPVGSSSSSARSAAFWPAASASKNVTTSSQ